MGGIWRRRPTGLIEPDHAANSRASCVAGNDRHERQLGKPLSKTAEGNFIEPVGHKTFVFDLPPGFDGGESAAGDVFIINYHGGIHSHMDGIAHFG